MISRYTRFFFAVKDFPMYLISSFSLTLNPGSTIFAPFTSTLPDFTISAASRREQMPACARNLFKGILPFDFAGDAGAVAEGVAVVATGVALPFDTVSTFLAPGTAGVTDFFASITTGAFLSGVTAAGLAAIILEGSFLNSGLITLSPGALPPRRFVVLSSSLFVLPYRGPTPPC